MASSRAARTVAVLPPPEDLPTIIPPPVPSALKLLVRAYEQHTFLEWLVVEAILHTVTEVFPYLHGTRTVREWAGQQGHAQTLRDPSADPQFASCVSLNTPALRLEHPEIPGERDLTYLLIPGGPGRELYCIVVLDREHLAEAQAAGRPVALTAFHVSTLEHGKLFAPEICRLVMHAVNLAAVSTETQVAYKVAGALRGLETDLRKLWALRGLSW